MIRSTTVPFSKIGQGARLGESRWQNVKQAPRKIIAGKAPRLKVHWRLFTDNWGHATAPLKVLSSYCNYAIIFKCNPVGLPLPKELANNAEFADPNPNK